MDQEGYDEQVMVRYLLGELSEREKQQLEERFFRDDAYFEQLEIIEEDLIDAYVSGTLSKAQQAHFEKYFLTSEKRRQRVEFARDLIDAARSRGPLSLGLPAERADELSDGVHPPDGSLPRSGRVSRWRSVLGWLRDQPLAVRLSLAAMPLVVLAGIGLTVETVRLGSHVRQLQAEGQAVRQHAQALQQQVADQNARDRQLASDLAREREDRARLERELAKGRPSLPPVISFILPPRITRDLNEPKRLHIPSGDYTIELQLDLEEERAYKSYRVELQTVKGDEIWSQGGLRARGGRSGTVVRLQLPSRLLSAGDYILTLKGITAEGDVQEVDDYFFRILRG